MRKIGKSTYFIALVAIGLVALGVVLLTDDAVLSETVSLQQENAGAEIGAVSAPTNSVLPPAKTENPSLAVSKSTADVAEDAPRPQVVEESEFTPAEQKTVDSIQDALDNEDLTKVAAQLKDAAASTNVAVRTKAVEALRWFGVKALPELTMFMADADDDVRTDAIDAYTMGLSEMEPGEAKADAVRMGLSVVTDKDQLESMVMQVDDLTDFQKLDVLTQIIEGDNKTAAEVAREHYKFWTEEDYTDLATAQKWLDAKESESVD